jgi:hypothetical protein
MRVQFSIDLTGNETLVGVVGVFPLFIFERTWGAHHASKGVVGSVYSPQFESGYSGRLWLD